MQFEQGPIFETSKARNDLLATMILDLQLCSTEQDIEIWKTEHAFNIMMIKGFDKQIADGLNKIPGYPIIEDELFRR